MTATTRRPNRIGKAERFNSPLPEIGGGDEGAALYAVADAAVPRMTAAVIAVRSLLAERVNKLIRDAVLMGDVSELRRAILLETVAVTDETFAPIVKADGEGLLLRDVELDIMGSASAKLGLRFDLTDPFAIAAAQENAARLVTGLGREASRSVTAAVTSGLQTRLGRSDVEHLIRGSVSMSVPQTNAYARLISATRTAQTYGNWDDIPTELRRELRAVRGYKLLDRRTTIPKPGMTSAQADRAIARYEERAIRHRAETIARTETMRAANAGKIEGARQMARSTPWLKTEKVWVASLVACPRCAPLHGEVVDIDYEFRETVNGLDGNVTDLPDDKVTTLDHPPLHPRCRCTITFRYTNIDSVTTESGPEEPAETRKATHIDDPIAVYSNSPVPVGTKRSTGGGDLALRAISRAQGFTSKPTLVASQAELDAEVARGGIAMFRGEGSRTFKASYMASDEQFMSSGIYGNGSYWANDLGGTRGFDVAMSYTGGDDLAVMSGVLRSDARTITHANASRRFRRWSEDVSSGAIETPPMPTRGKPPTGPRPSTDTAEIKRIYVEQGVGPGDAAYDAAKAERAAWDFANASEFEPITEVIGDEGAWAAANGYDAIVEASYPSNYNVVLNRGAMMILDDL